MVRFMRCAIAAAILSAALAGSSFAIVGVGVHYGIDLSLNMDDKFGETIDFLKINYSTIPGFDSTQLPAALQSLGGITGADIPIYVDRSDWKRNPLNFGGKLFIDIIPVIDAIEVSTNFGLWEYTGQIRYPTSITLGPNASTATRLKDALVVVEDTMPMTLKSLGMPSFFGLLTQTPYAKLNFDVTVRKNIVAIPKHMKIFRLYAGAGPSIHFATPALSTSLIEDAVGTRFTNNLADIQNVISNPVDMKKVLEKIIADLMTPHMGMHLDVGVMLKLPVVPVGFYVDGKYMIMFGELDKNVKLGGNGLLLNGGITVGL